MDSSYPSLIRRFGHWNVSALLGIVCLIVTVGVDGADETERAKRVLMVHSFGSTAPPFTTHSTAFETTLTQEMGKRIDLDEVSLDMARYAQPDMEEPFVEFLLKRLGKWDPDLVVPVGSPAGRFVAASTGPGYRRRPPVPCRSSRCGVGTHRHSNPPRRIGGELPSYEIQSRIPIALGRRKVVCLTSSLSAPGRRV